MLIPHDFKSQSGDMAMLHALEKKLRHDGFTHVRYTPINRPDKIKRIVGLLDLVITGRMHLAIASLGCGTPTLSITYQDKFEGLYQHFGLPFEHIIAPMQCLGDELLARINHAFTQRHDNREHILASLPQVKALALRNLVIAGVDAAQVEANISNTTVTNET
jgi:colanic acid/amylovoran biosynthesis protein